MDIIQLDLCSCFPGANATSGRYTFSEKVKEEEEEEKEFGESKSKIIFELNREPAEH